MNLFIILSFLPMIAFAANRCVVGEINKENVERFGAISLKYSDCSGGGDTCFRYLENNIYHMGCELSIACEDRLNSSDVSEIVCCISEICNPPPNITANKDELLLSRTISKMRSMMYTIMGSIFMVLWLLFAFLLGVIPSLYLVFLGIVDVILGYFLVFIPAAHYLGLYFALLGVATIAIEIHLKDTYSNRWIIVASVIGFLLIAGLTFIPFTTTPFLERIVASNCVADLGLDNNPNQYVIGLPTRCENYLLYVLFCVYLLILMQPFKIMLAFKHAASVLIDKHNYREDTATDIKMKVHKKKSHH